MIALILFLVFFPDNSADSATNNNDNIQIDTPNSNSSNSDTLIFATNLSLNCPRSIQITLGESVELLEDYIYVEPYDCVENVSYTISGRYGSNADGIKFSNNIISTFETGTYYIKFSVPSSDDYYLTDGIQISVVEDKNTNVIQLLKILEIGNEYSLEQIFTFNTKANITVEIEDENYILINNNIFIPQNGGKTNIKLSLIYEYIKYNYTYLIQINDRAKPPEYTIEIYTEITELEVGGIYPIEYAVIDKNGVSAYQYVKVESSNEDIVEITSSDYPLIFIKCKTKGDVTIKITYTLDESITKEIKLSVK